MKFVVKWLLTIPSHLKHVTTLPCETVLPPKPSFSWGIIETIHLLRCTHNFNGFYLLTYCFSFWFTLNILCIEQTMLGAHCTTMMNSSRVWCTFGTAWTRPSLTVQLISGVAVFVLVCGQRVGTLNKCWHLLRRLSFSSVTINVSFVTLCHS